MKVRLKKPIMQLDHCINFMLNKTQNAVLIHFRDRLAEYQVTPVQYAALKCLWTEDNKTPKQIANEIMLDASTITGILDRLESKDLVVRTPSVSDRRTLIISLTDAGKALQTDIDRIILESNHEVLRSLSEEEQASFRDYLDRVFKTCQTLR